MHSLSELARQANLPRRVVQYWHDRGVIVPLSARPIVYSDDELRLVRVLGALAHSKPAIEIVAEYAHMIRLAMADDHTVPTDVRRAVAAARRGEEAYLGLAPSTTSQRGTWFYTFGANNPHELANSVMQHTRHRGETALSVVNLGYCFNLALHSGSIILEEAYRGRKHDAEGEAEE